MSYSISWHTLLGPWNVKYPTNFYDGGDSAAQVFEKHIQEIIRIYGLLNALDEGKLDIGDFERAMDAHINDSDPHPNLQHNTLRGKEGGGGGHWYHLDGDQLDKLDNMEDLIQGMIDNAIGGLETGGGGGGTDTHNSLNGLQGGGGGNYYHLSKEQYDNLGSGGGGATVEVGNGYVRIGGFAAAWGRANAEKYQQTLTLPVTFDRTNCQVCAQWGNSTKSLYVAMQLDGKTLTFHSASESDESTGITGGASVSFSYIVVGATA